MAIIVTYDIPGKHTELKTALSKIGYNDKLYGTKCGTLYFPNTTLYHETKSSTDAVRDVESACRTLNVKLERCVSTIWSSTDFICGQ